jgi:parvulin-like peptidyl-prolyl isomerase
MIDRQLRGVLFASTSVLAALASCTAALAQGLSVESADASIQHQPTQPQDLVLARVGDDAIMVSEFMNWLVKDAQRVRTAATPQGRANLLKSIIASQLLTRAMRDEGFLEPASEEPNEVELAEAMSELRAQHFPAPSPPSDEQVAAFYESHKEAFGIPATVRVSQVQIAVPDTPTNEQKAAARERAEQALKRIAGGESFAEVAEEVTDNADARSAKGDLGYLALNANEWLDNAVDGLEVGEMTGIIESPVGYEILMLTDRKAPIFTPLDDVRDAVTAAWTASKQATTRAEYLKELAARYGVTIEDAALKEAYPDGLF